MLRLLLDTNVILDVLLDRDPWVAEARLLWEANLGERIQAHVTATSLTDIFSVARRLVGREQAWEAIRAILDQLHILAVGRFELVRATMLPSNDFEDNLQLSCALAGALDAIVTRDPSGFSGASLPIWSPQDAIDSLPGEGPSAH